MTDREKCVANTSEVMHAEDEETLACNGPEEFASETDAEFWLLMRDAHLKAAELAEGAAMTDPSKRAAAWEQLNHALHADMRFT